MNDLTAESDDSAQPCVHRYAWLVNPGTQPRQNVRVSVDNGTIAEITDVPADESHLIEPVAALPPLVNAHTHLEFSRLPTPLPPPAPFTDWIGSVIRYRGGLQDPAEANRNAIQEGLDESRRAGVRSIGEITTSGSGFEGVNHAARHGQTVVCFRELLGFLPNGIDDQLAMARQHLTQTTQDSIVCGLSPHAPYSVHPELFVGVVDMAAHHGCPVAMHLAETTQERELLDTQSGLFRDFLTTLGLWDPLALEPGSTPLRYFKQLSRLPRALAIHCNYLSARELRFLCDHPHVAVVYCPRTHAWFGHTTHPWRQLQNGGGTVILGTDSRASNPDLSIWKELQHVGSQPAAPPVWDLLPMITTTAANALGLNASEHTLRPGIRFGGVSVACHATTPEALNQQLLRNDIR